MATFALNNKLSGTKTFGFDPSILQRHPGEGILPMSLAVEDRIGTETALILLDRTPFIYELAKVRPFNLMLKSGVVRTSHGPVAFFLFWFPDPRQPQMPFASFDCHANPLDRVLMLPWRDLARQSHWHLILVDGKGQVVDVFEFPNEYGMADTLEQFDQVCQGMTCGDFLLAKSEFCERCSLEYLFEL